MAFWRWNDHRHFPLQSCTSKETLRTARAITWTVWHQNQPNRKKIVAHNRIRGTIYSCACVLVAVRPMCSSLRKLLCDTSFLWNSKHEQCQKCNLVFLFSIRVVVCRIVFPIKIFHNATRYARVPFPPLNSQPFGKLYCSAMARWMLLVFQNTSSPATAPQTLSPPL